MQLPALHDPYPTPKRIFRDTKTAEEKKFYSSSLWTKFSLQHRQREPLCRSCKAAGRIQLGEIADHIIPIREGGERWDDNNLQTLCRPCDQRKRQQERNHHRKPLDPIEEARRLPRDIPQSRIPVTIICGPPGSGKSTYVREHAGSNDLVIDLDRIYQQLSGLPEHYTQSTWLVPALNERNRLLRSLSTDITHAQAWFIISLPHPSERTIWKDMLGANLVLLSVSIDECIRRIHADTTRKGYTERMIDACRDWYTISNGMNR